MKLKLYLIIMMLAIPIVTAIIQCEDVITPNDIPCQIISTWTYSDCNSTQVKIYNSTPNLLDTKNFTDFGASGRCNFTWNIRDRDSYHYNITNGDSGHVTVEVDETMSLAIVIGLSIFAAIFIGIGLVLWFHNRGKKDDQE